jgi:hypothetical protein
LFLTYYETFFRNGLILVLLSSLSNKTILHNEKIFKIIAIILILIIAVVVFLYFVSTPLPEGQQGAKAEALTDIQAAINQTAWFRRRFF